MCNIITFDFLELFYFSKLILRRRSLSYINLSIDLQKKSKDCFCVIKIRKKKFENLLIHSNEYILKLIYTQINTYSNENFTFLIVRILELYTRRVCEIFLDKHCETIEYIKN